MTSLADSSFNPVDVRAIRDAMRNHGVERIFVKKLAGNDNSKQQIYLGPDLSALPMFPQRPIETRTGSSTKPGASGKPIFRMPVDWHWLDSNGTASAAPTTKLIYYPQFPEVRLSGFLQNAAAAPRSMMQATHRMEGRTLLFGVGSGNRVIGLVLPPESPAARELAALELPRFNSLFAEMSANVPLTGSSRELLIARLAEIHEKGWIAAKRLDRDGKVLSPYEDRNSGGYTLEAEFGVIPNGDAEPDYLGWELKQFRLPKCESKRSVPITLMTPEPDGGHYNERGAESFVRRYGYWNPNHFDRMDFTGRHRIGATVKRTRTSLLLEGADQLTGEILSASGGVILARYGEDQPAARWSFAKLLEHWQRKHQHAVYVPSLAKANPKAHSFCPVVRLAQGTEFAKLLRLLASGIAYYDPGTKIVNAGTRPETKRRNQFRIGTGQLPDLYDHWEIVDVMHK